MRTLRPSLLAPTKHVGLVGLAALSLAACGGQVAPAAEDGPWEQSYVAPTRAEPLVQVLVLDDRPSTELARNERYFGARSALLGEAFASLVPRRSAVGEWIPLDLTLVLVFPSSGRVIGPPDEPALHVHSTNFDPKAAAELAATVTRLLAAQPSHQGFYEAYAPLRAMHEAVELLASRRAPRDAAESRLRASVEGVASVKRARGETWAPVVVTAPFDDGAVPTFGADVLPTVYSTAGCREARWSYARQGREQELACLSLAELPAPIAPGTSTSDALWASPALHLAGRHARSSLGLSNDAVDTRGRARCFVDVVGADLDCEAHGWTRTPASGRTTTDARVVCGIPQLEGPDAEACRRGSTCESCAPGFCAVASPIDRVSGPAWHHLGFVKNAFPWDIEGSVSIVCDLEP